MFMASRSGNSTVPLQVEDLEARRVLSNAQYVNALYNDLLHRAPASSEVTLWSNALRAGGDPLQVALDFTSSPEYLGDLIRADYQTFLGRQPTAAEVNGWLTQLQAGLGENQLQADFLASDEFFADHGSNVTSWLSGVYQDVLGRALDSGGLANWSQQLQAGMSRFAVALGIVTSPEAFTRLVDAAYQNLLGRAADAVGQAYWVTQLEQGMTPSHLLARFASSTEFIADQGGLNVPPKPIAPPPGESFEGTPFIGPPFVGGFVGGTTAGFTGPGFTGGGFTGGGFTGGGFTGGGFSGGGST
jgi:hypothetical protein